MIVLLSDANTSENYGVVSKPRITPEGKAQADSKAPQPRQVVSIARGLQRRHRVSDGVMELLLKTGLFQVGECIKEVSLHQFFSFCAVFFLNRFNN
jgi:hypothetical protein